MLSLGEVAGPQQCSDPNWDGAHITYWSKADLLQGNGEQSGYWVNDRGNGDRDWGTFQGRITSSDGQTSMAGTFEWTGGTGKFANIRGSGTYKGLLPSSDQVENAWEGEYEL